jgi:hypothetical protein
MKKADIQELTDMDLIVAIYWKAVNMTNEVNSRRGLTKQTRKEEAWMLEEIAKRNGWDVTQLNEKICK